MSTPQENVINNSATASIQFNTTDSYIINIQNNNFKTIEATKLNELSDEDKVPYFLEVASLRYKK